MTTDSFINALRRFVCRRGSVSSIRCDNGTNFVGAKNELQKEFSALNHQKIGDFLAAKDCQYITWKHNPPKGSHMGGIWERSIRSVRSIITAILLSYGRKLNDEVLTTFMCEAESIVNCRPITVENLLDPSITVLTPNHLLTMKSRVPSPPPGEFTRCDEYTRKRWRTVQLF